MVLFRSSDVKEYDVHPAEKRLPDYAAEQSQRIADGFRESGVETLCVKPQVTSVPEARISAKKQFKTFRHAYISFVRKTIVPTVSSCTERKPFRH
jgi:hypothetical protein